MPSRPTWSASRPSRAAAGPPGLAALMDAERSALRDHHDRLRTLDAAQREASVRASDVDAAEQRQGAAQNRSPGMRDRLRSSPHHSRLLLADVRATAKAAKTAVEAAHLRALASQVRLSEVRGFVDGLAAGDQSLLLSLRRSSELPGGVERFPTIPAFISDHPDRARGDARQQDLVGQPLGDRWTLEESGRPWISTTWRAAWSADGDAPMGEVYAVEAVTRPHAARRVIWLGYAEPSPSVAHTLESLLGRQDERNSLAALADTVSNL